MNAHDASTANTNNAARALKPVDRPSGVAPAADAFKALEAEYAKLPNDNSPRSTSTSRVRSPSSSAPSRACGRSCLR